MPIRVGPALERRHGVQIEDFRQFYHSLLEEMKTRYGHLFNFMNSTMILLHLHFTLEVLTARFFSTNLGMSKASTYKLVA